ncbi:hypothetical protein LJ16_06215 [Lactobacillus johnsonii 16]|nr:hypothetical protein LJ16_06215 [Lactobacillus johnsonii 16]
MLYPLFLFIILNIANYQSYLKYLAYVVKHHFKLQNKITCRKVLKVKDITLQKIMLMKKS